MNSQFSAVAWKRKARCIVVCLAASAPFPVAAFAKSAAVCTTGTTLRLSAPQASQGSLLLIEVRSTKPLVEVQGEWGGRTVPIWQEAEHERQRKGLLAVDLEKAPGEYELKLTGQTATGEKISCSPIVAVRKGLFSTGEFKMGKEFAPPHPQQVNTAT